MRRGGGPGYTRAMSRPSSSRLLALVAILSLCATPLAAEEKTAPEKAALKNVEPVRTPGEPRGGGLKRELMLVTARQVTRGYYGALIEAKYDEAASFLHPSAIEPLRKRVLEDLEKSPPQKAENTLALLGVKDLNALRTMSLDGFYVAWAKSSYGQGVQVLARKDLAVDVVLDPPTCSLQHRVCKVDLKLRARGEDGKKMESPSTVWVLEHEGRWLLTNVPPA